MNKFLNDAISIRGATQTARAGEILHLAKVDKVTLNNLVVRLNEKSMLSNTVLPTIDKGSIISGSMLANMFSDTYSRIEEMFSSSNAISLLMTNTASILSQEIKNLEEELFSLEKSLNNYGFLLADGNAYDSAFMETFSNSLNFEDLDFETKNVTDRSGINFNISESAQILKDEGVLTISPSVSVDYPLKASIWASNCAAMMTNPSNGNAIDNTIDYLKINGWRAVVDSPVIINNPLYMYANIYNGTKTFDGAQFILQYEMIDENPVDTLVVEPFGDYGFTIAQIIGFNSDSDQSGKELLSEPIEVEKTVNILFPKDSFKKFHIYINQKTYIRQANNKITSESVAELRSATSADLETYGKDPSLTIKTEYPVINITKYWSSVFDNLKSSLGQSDVETFRQGLPSYWSLDGKFSDHPKKQIDNEGNYLDRQQSPNPNAVHASYIQSVIGRFFGRQDNGIGSFFNPIVAKYFNSNSHLNSAQIYGNNPYVRNAPYPMQGSADEGREIVSSEIEEGGWTAISKLDNGPFYKGAPSDDYVWSETLGTWVVKGPNSGAMPDITDFNQDLITINDPDWDSLLKPARNKKRVSQRRFFIQPYPNPIDKDVPLDHLPPGGDFRYTIPSVGYDDIVASLNNSYYYRYIIGIKHIRARLSNYVQRGIYISKPIGASGEIAQVKLKEYSINFVQDSINENNYLTSVEYSITNNQDIYNEANWKPILPINSNMVSGERLFPDQSGVANFRFNALGDNVVLYKNGTEFSGIDIASAYIRRPNSNTIYGLKIPLSLYSNSDVLTCDYIPDQLNNIVSFDNFSDLVNSYVSYSDDISPGEKFYGNGNVEFSLTHSPYISYKYVETSTYSDLTGTTPYQPISVVFEDGSSAINLTNYKNNETIKLDASANGYSFLHSGNIIIFNKPVNTRFTVLYNYFPTNFRVRIILRSNYLNPVSPKVDFYQVKSKTRAPDSRRY